MADGVVDVVVTVVVEHKGCEEVVVEVEEVVVDVASVELVVELDGGGGPICSLTDLSVAPRGSILFTDSLSCDSGPPPLVKSGELRSNWEVDLDMPDPLLPLLPIFIMFIMEPLLIPVKKRGQLTQEHHNCVYVCIWFG